MMNCEFKCRFYPEYIIAGSRRGAFCIPVDYENIYYCPGPSKCDKGEAALFQKCHQIKDADRQVIRIHGGK